MAACCYFGIDLGEGLDHYSLPLLTDGTPHSSSDLLYFFLMLSFTWTNYFKSISLLPFAFLDKNFLNPISLLFGQKYSKSNFNFAKRFRKKTIPNSVSTAKSFQFCNNILSPIFILNLKNSLLSTNTFHTVAAGV